MHEEFIQESNKPDIFKRLLFSFCFFHAVIQDRRKFGPIGWNIPYAFTTEDLTACRRQLMSFINQYDVVPIKVLVFLGASINYGGRVTDDKDKRLITTILSKYVCDEAVSEKGYSFSNSGIYHIPEVETLDEYVQYIKDLPLSPTPEAFGMDENCAISCAEGDAQALLNGILAVYAKSGSGGGGKSKDDVLDEIVGDLHAKIPPTYDIDYVEKR